MWRAAERTRVPAQQRHTMCVGGCLLAGGSCAVQGASAPGNCLHDARQDVPPSVTLTHTTLYLSRSCCRLTVWAPVQGCPGSTDGDCQLHSSLVHQAARDRELAHSLYSESAAACAAKVNPCLTPPQMNVGIKGVIPGELTEAHLKVSAHRGRLHWGRFSSSGPQTPGFQSVRGPEPRGVLLTPSLLLLHVV